NDLDIDTLQELESLLDSWPGTLVVISHDRYLIERIADDTYALFGDGKLTNLPGGIEEYLKIRAEHEAASPTGALNLGEGANNADASLSAAATAGVGSAAARTPSAGTPVAGATTAGAAAQQSSLSNQEQREITKKMNALERKISKLDPQIAKVNADMAAAAQQ